MAAAEALSPDGGSSPRAASLASALARMAVCPTASSASPVEDRADWLISPTVVSASREPATAELAATPTSVSLCLTGSLAPGLHPAAPHAKIKAEQSQAGVVRAVGA